MAPERKNRHVWILRTKIAPTMMSSTLFFGVPSNTPNLQPRYGVLSPVAATSETITGRATGVLFFTGFGSLWTYTGLAALNYLNLWTGLITATILAFLAVPAILLLLRPKTAAQTAADDRHVSRMFTIINVIEGLAIVLSLILLNVFHRTEYIIPTIAIIVGLHLIPLASLFRYAPHYVTGALLVVWSLAVTVLLPRENIGSYGALRTAAILDLRAANTLLRTCRTAVNSAL